MQKSIQNYNRVWQQYKIRTGKKKHRRRYFLLGDRPFAPPPPPPPGWTPLVTGIPKVYRWWKGFAEQIRFERGRIWKRMIAGCHNGSRRVCYKLQREACSRRVKMCQKSGVVSSGSPSVSDGLRKKFAASGDGCLVVTRRTLWLARREAEHPAVLQLSPFNGVTLYQVIARRAASATSAAPSSSSSSGGAEHQINDKLRMRVVHVRWLVACYC